MDSYISRIEITRPVPEILHEVIRAYKLGELVRFNIFERGYEDFNVKLVTTSGTYIVKIFSKLRHPKFIKSYVEVLTLLSEKNLPTPKHLPINNSYLYTIHDGKKQSQLCVMNHFSDTSLLDQPPTKKDFLKVAEFLGKLHKITIPVYTVYDSWGVVNITSEYAKNAQYVPTKYRSIVDETVELYSAIDLSGFRKSLIHGDIQREHVLKNDKGTLCIIDWACMSNNSCVVDLGIFYAQFGIDLSMDLLRSFISDSLKIYTKETPLSSKEIGSIPIMMRAHHAAYLIKTSYFIYKTHDTSRQTRDWFNFSSTGLQQLEHFNI
ncbi:MAG: phosphotransferase [Candidatus Gottesmanbacteria bacterium]|nr:phosphotransferase [Candidatus Gottesmanbacteria bacterium]